MMPETITFTGLELSPKELTCNRVHPGPFPGTWARLVIPYRNFNVRPLQEWLLEQIDGRFGIHLVYPQAAIYFERDMDAVMFRLKDGDNEFANSSDDFF